MPKVKPQTLLQQVLASDNLRAAWEAVAANRGMPGVDDLSISTWLRTWEERLVILAKDGRCNFYRPQRLRR